MTNQQLRVQFFSSCKEVIAVFLLLQGLWGFLVGKSVGHSGSFLVTLFRDLPVPAFLFLFHNTLPRDFTMNFHSLPNPWGFPNCRGWEESRRKLVPCRNSCHGFYELWVSGFLRCGCVQCWKLRLQKRKHFLSILEYKGLFNLLPFCQKVMGLVEVLT